MITFPTESPDVQATHVIIYAIALQVVGLQIQGTKIEAILPIEFEIETLCIAVNERLDTLKSIEHRLEILECLNKAWILSAQHIKHINDGGRWFLIRNKMLVISKRVNGSY